MLQQIILAIDISLLQNHNPTVRPAPPANTEPLPTVEEMRARARDQIKSEKQAFFERRFRARQLLFAKGRGSLKNLPHKDRQFILSVKRETYQLYLQEFVTGKSRYGVGKTWNRKLRRREGAEPEKLSKWQRHWYASQKVRYMRFDIPLMFKKRMEELKYGDTLGRNPAVR